MFFPHRQPARMRLPYPLQAGCSLMANITSDDLCRENFQLYLQDDCGRNVVLLVQYMFQNKVWLLNYKDDGQWGVEAVKTVFELFPFQFFTLDIYVESEVFFVGMDGSPIAEVPVMVSLRLATSLVVKGPVSLRYATYTSAGGLKHVLCENPVEVTRATELLDAKVENNQKLKQSEDALLQNLPHLKSTPTEAIAAEPPAEGNLGPSTSSSISPPDSPPRADDTSPDRIRKFSAVELSRLKEKAASAFEEMRLKSAMRTDTWKQQVSLEHQIVSRSSVSQSVRTLTPSQAFTIEPEGQEPSHAIKSVTFFDTVEPQNGTSTARISTETIQPRRASPDRPEPVSTGFSRMLEAQSDPMIRRRLSDLETPDGEASAPDSSPPEKPFIASLVTLMAGSRGAVRGAVQRSATAVRSDSNKPEPAHREDFIASALVLADEDAAPDAGGPPAIAAPSTAQAEASDKGDLSRCKTVMNMNNKH